MSVVRPNSPIQVIVVGFPFSSSSACIGNSIRKARLQRPNQLQRCRRNPKFSICEATGAVVPLVPGEHSVGLGKIGFLGMGIMGRAMALNLIKGGYDVTVWNRSPERCDPLVTAGASLGTTPAAVVASCDVTIAMLADPAACLEIALGKDGVVQGISTGKGYVDVSTVDAETAQKVEAAVHAAGGQYLEAPVSGSKGPAEQGQLIFLTGGDKCLFDAAKPLLDVMGKASFFLGATGAGANMKLVVNMVMGSMMAAFSEGLILAEQSGLQQSDLLDVIRLGAIASPMFALKGPSMVKGEFPTAFPLKHQQKDMKLALQLAADKNLPVAASANDLYCKALTNGLGDADFSAVLSALRENRSV